MRRALLTVLAVLAIAIAALVGFALSEQGLPFVVARIVAQSGGHIVVEGPSGSIAGTMRFRRVIWRESDIVVTADDVIVDWNPGALWSWKLSIRGLGARHVDIAIKPSAGATSPPTDLALPLPVDIEELGVGRIDWHTGPREGHVTGLEFGYRGTPREHEIRNLRVVTAAGTVRGSLDIAARAPLTVRGRATIAGSDLLDGVRLRLALSGRLEAIAVDGEGTLREAPLTLSAIVTPFAAAPFADAKALVTAFDASTFDASFPHTAARLRIDAKPAGSGFAGTLDLVNDAAGPIDRGALPVTKLSASYRYGSGTLRLDDMILALHGGGNASGKATIVTEAGSATGRAPTAPEGTGATGHAGPGVSNIALSVHGVDLAQLYTRLAATRLSGTIEGEGDASTQTVRGKLTDRDRSFAFRATANPARIEVTEFEARDRGGSLAGTGTLARDGAGTFSARAVLRSIDPSRFLAVAPGSLRGTVEIRGRLDPEWEASVGATIARGSRYAGLAVTGTGSATVTPSSITGAKLDLAIASATLRIKEARGPGWGVSFALDVPRLAELAPILPAALPRPLSGAIHASGSVDFAGAPTRLPALVSDPPALVGALSGRLTLQAERVRAGPKVALAKGTMSGTLATAGAPRAITLDASASGIETPLRRFTSAHLAIAGSVAAHHIELALEGDDLDLSAALAGAVSPPGLEPTEPQRTAPPAGHAAARAAPLAWHGELISLTNKGAIPLTLSRPATIDWSRGHLAIANLHLALLTGRASVDAFTWDAGKITTRGSITGVSVARAAALAGHPLPFESTLEIGGDWAIRAEPRLTGSFHLARESGDIEVTGPSAGNAARELGITRLVVSGTLTGDALAADGEFHSTLAGDATAHLALGCVDGAEPGTLSRDAPLALDVRASLASLAVFQSWIGTDAVVDGRLDATVSARGTLRDPRWSGSIDGESIRLDAARYGVALAGGRIRAHIAPTGIVLDEASIDGGDGRFSASGNIALPGAPAGTQSSVRWKADHFRVANRPDLRFIVDGEGTLREENRRIALAGTLRIDEGHVEYEPSPSGKLAPDIVIVGAPRREENGDALRNTPLALDVEVDLGPAMTFVGDGLEARLAGKVKIATAADGTLAGHGTIRTVDGTYYAFGQKLTIDRGRVIFDGPLDNPALDVVALRKNLPVEAGVQVSGSAKLPLVHITSNPPVPENEALAWLITGQGLASSGRADYAAISAASALLLSRGGKPLTAQIAQRFGLDELSVQSAGTTGTNGVANQVVVLGKRLSDRLTLGYEQGISIATSALRLDYALSRRVTVRAEAGTVSGVSIVYRRSFR